MKFMIFVFVVVGALILMTSREPAVIEVDKYPAAPVIETEKPVDKTE